MQPVSSRIWTRVAMPISYDGNHYTTGTSFYTVWIVNCRVEMFLKKGQEWLKNSLKLWKEEDRKDGENREIKGKDKNEVVK